MLKIINFLVLIILLVSCNSQPDHSNADFILQNVKLFDGDTVLNNATIIIQDSIIKKIYLNQDFTFSGENVIDGKGATVTPGLIDAHVHMDLEQGEKVVKAGVLTVLEMARFTNSSLDSIHKLGNTSSYFPYIYSAGNPVTVPNGHPTQFEPRTLTITSADELPEFIKKRADEGSDYIKIFMESGGPDFRFPRVTDEMVETAIKSAKQYNLMPIAHVSKRADAIQATKMGMSGFVHFWFRNFTNDDPTIDTARISQEELDIFVKHKVFVIPTIRVWVRFPEVFPIVKIDMEAMKQEIGRVHTAGIPILAGTDAPTFGVDTAIDLYREMEYLSECGISNIDVLKTATSNTSRAFNLGNKGFVKEGFSADLLLIDGDPTTNIKDIRKITGIWKQGVKIK